MGAAQMEPQMKLFSLMKDGGPHSKVWGYWLIEFKSLFSVVLLRFEDGSREAFHSHAFNCISWVLSGCLWEQRMVGRTDLHYTDIKKAWRVFAPSWKPIITTRDNLHKVTSIGRTWVLSFRGPWADTWQEYLPDEERVVTLTHGRVEVIQ